MTDAPASPRGVKWRAPLWAAIAIAIAAYQLGPMLNAEWELFDDGATLTWAAPRSTLKMRDVPSVLLHQTEVGEFGKTPRYRPVYYAVRVAEFAALGPSPRRWHAGRMAMFGIVIFLIFAAFDVWLGAWVGAALTIFVVANWYWQDVWLHLGPAEGIGMVGLSIFALGATLTTRGELRAAAWFTAVGTAIAVGSKESFLPLILPCLLVLECVRRRSTRKGETIALEILAAAMTGAVTLSTVLFSLRAGTDQYAHPVSSVSRVSWLFGGWGVAFAVILILPAALEAAGWKLIAPERRTPELREEWRRRIHAFRAVAWCAAALVAFQLFIYMPVAGWPTFASRYDVPGRLASPALIGASISLIIAFGAMSGRTSWIPPFRALCVAALLLIARREFPWGLRGAAIRQVAHTQALDATLNSYADTLREHRGVPVIVYWNSGGEIESFGSTLQFLVQRGISGPFYLMPMPEPGPPVEAAFVVWGEQMKELAVHGGTWYGAEIHQWPGGGIAAIAPNGAFAELRMHLYEIPALTLIGARP